MFSNNHYSTFRAARFKVIDKYITNSFLQNKTLIEVGCANGHNGAEFLKRGCSSVTCTDARPEHFEVGRSLFPNITFNVLDCENDSFDKQYDICLHWGTLYHLKNIEDNLMRVCKDVNYLFLETECCDSDDTINTYINEVDSYGGDQAKGGIGSRPSPSYVEKLLADNNFEFKRIKDTDLNCLYYLYDWAITNTKEFYLNGIVFRGFWIAWRKDMPSPFMSE